MNCCNESIHGHDVMHIILEKGPIERQALTQIVQDQFGEFPSFHTCSASGMDLPQLLDFLLQRSKISEGPHGLFMGNGQHTCDHG